MSYQEAKAPICTEQAGAVELTIEPRERDLGGFSVRRVLPSSKRRMVGPFIFFDEMGPAGFAADQGIDVRPHPHIGLATITYLFEGEILHRDSLGHVQAIRPGAVNLMKAGSGIVHSERTGPDERKTATRLHGIQSWIALPTALEESEPAFHHHRADSLPVLERDGARLRLIAGEAYDESAPVETASPMFYVEADLSAGTRLSLPDDYPERAAYLVSGAIEANGEPVEPHSMAVFSSNAAVSLIASVPSKVMLIGGARLDGKRHIWWNFVSSRPERIEQAKADWKAGRFAKVPGDDEFIPLPGD